MTQSRADRRLHPPLSFFLAFVLLAGVFPLIGAESPKGMPAPSRRVNISPLPSWVERIAPEMEAKVPGASSSYGTFFLLSDTQTHVETGASYRHYAVKILSDSGVQSSSSVEAEWDPSFERLDFHFVRVHRGGAAQDRLDPEAFTVIQREENLESYLFDGSLSAILFLEDVRKGDVIEYAYSVTGRNPAFGGAFSDSCGLAYSVPVARLRHRLVHPLGRRISVKTFSGGREPERSTSGNDETVVWDLRDVGAVLAEDDLPDWFDPYAYAQQSEYSSWAEVARWALGVFGPRMKADQGLKALAAELKSSHPEREGAILAAIRFVQDEIRYLGIEIGAYSHTPNEPETVLKRRYGDCKDKALLLAALLREMGEKAYPALVATDSGPLLEEGLPSPYAFNHAVTVLDYPSGRIWIDPTISFQRGSLSTLYFPDYHKGLVLEPGAEILTDIPAPEPGALAVDEDFELAAEDGGKDILTVASSFSGSEADDMRYRLSGESVESMAQDYLDYYSDAFPGIERSGGLEIRDDESANVISIVERYELELGGGRVDFSAGDLSSYLVLPENRERSMPYALGRPINVSQTITVRPLPDFSHEKDDIAIETREFDFSYSSDFREDRLRLGWKLRLKAESVAAEALRAYRDKADEALDYAEYSIDFSDSGNSALNYPFAVSLALAAILTALSYRLLAARGAEFPAPGFLSPTGRLGKALGPRAANAAPFLCAAAIALSVGLLLLGAASSRAIKLDDWYDLSYSGASPEDKTFALALMAEGLAEASLAGLGLLGLAMLIRKRREFPALFALYAAGSAIFALADIALAFGWGRSGTAESARACALGCLAFGQAFVAWPFLMVSGGSRLFYRASGSLIRGGRASIEEPGRPRFPIDPES